MFDIMDSIFSIVFFGAFFVIIAAAFFIRSNMAFFIIGLLIVVIFGFIAAVLSNTYQEYVSSDPDLLTFVQDNFTLSNHIMNNYPIYAIVLGLVVLIVLYAKISGAPT